MFTLYWLDGKREVIKGSTISEAFSSAGLGAGAIRALDFYAEGDDQEYTYDLKKHYWVKKSDGINL